MSEFTTETPLDNTRPIKLTPDQAATALKEIKELSYLLNDTKTRIVTNTITAEMRRIHCGLIEHHAAALCTALDHASVLEAEIALRYTELRRANQTIQELRDALADQRETTGIPEVLSRLRKTVYEYWQELGFTYVDDSPYPGREGGGGIISSESRFQYIATLSIRINDDGPVYSTTPVSDQRTIDERIAYLRKHLDLQYEESCPEYRVLDTPKNRQWIIAKLRERFPSIYVMEWRNSSTYVDPDQHLLTYASVRIETIEELVPLDTTEVTSDVDHHG